MLATRPVSSVQLSLVIPLLNEAESLPELTAWIQRVADSQELSYEIILVDDGSTDDSWSVIQALQTANPAIRGIKFRRNYGKSAALNVGFTEALGKVVITMDADLQDSPDEIPELYRLIAEEKYDLISGWKQKRFDPPSKTIPTKLFNGATRAMTGIPLHDFNCGLKAYRAEVIKNIEVYGEMHRYIPVLAKTAGFKKIGEKIVQHQARKYGKTKFGWERFVNGFLDLLTITFVGRFGKKPMHFFGSLGLVSFLLGFGLLAFMSIEKLFYAQYGMTERPLFFFGIVLLIIGSQLFLAGFLAELIARSSPQRNNYQVEDII